MSMKNLKKISVLFLCALCMFFSTVLCSAASQRYSIPEIDDMIIYLPDGMSAITRSSQDTDKYFAVFGLDYNATMQNFQNGDIYLQGMDNSSSFTVTVTMTKTSESQGIGNYNLLDENELAEVRNNFLSQNEYTSCTPDSTDKIVWLNFNTNVNNNGKFIKAYQANTVYDGMSVNITLQRNEGDVTSDDYAVFAGIVSSVSFLKAGSSNSLTPYIIIGAVVLAIFVVVLIIIFTKYAKKRSKRTQNDKIINELANKYSLNRGKSSDDSKKQSRSNHTSIDSDNIAHAEIEYPDNDFDNSEDDELLGANENEDIDTYAQTIEPKESLNDSENIYNISSHSQEADEKTDEVLPLFNDNSQEDDEGEFTAVSDEDEYDDYNNDEELVRQETKHAKFYDSDDFFEEAPKKTMGVISSKEIQNAEDYDVINEVEKRVSEVETEHGESKSSFTEILKKSGNGLKSFGIHFGYFCTNMSRMIERRSAAKKRRKAEEERRERARMRAARERQQRREMQNGGLVQVHSRTEHRAPQNRRSTSQRSNSQSGQNSRNRHSNSTQRRR